MPKVLAILFVSIIVFLHLNIGGPRGLKGLFILLIPLYFSIQNITQQRRLVGSWGIQWNKFWMAFILQLMIIGIPGLVAFQGETYPYNLAIPAYISKRQIHSDVNYNKSGSSTPSISQRALLTAILKSSSDMSLA